MSTPIRWILLGCASATTGQAAAPPRVTINARRFMRSSHLIRRETSTAQEGSRARYPILTAQPTGWLVNAAAGRAQSGSSQPRDVGSYYYRAVSSVRVANVHSHSNHTTGFEQRLGLDQVRRPEAFGELIINRLQQRERFTATTLAAQEACKIACGAQLPRKRVLPPSGFQALGQQILDFAEVDPL